MDTNIPKGNSKEDVYIRRAIIVQHLATLIGKSVPCAAFSPRQVKVVFDSVDETATHAAKRYESTCAALQLKRLLKTATIVKNTAPHSNKQKKMGFVKVYELASFLPETGAVKIIVGEKRNTRIIHYCITKKE